MKNKNLCNIAEDFSKEAIVNSLCSGIIGRSLCFYESIDSTNNEAKKNICMPHGTLFAAVNQTKGRGRRGNAWISDKDSLCFSILLKPAVRVEYLSQITLISAIVIKRVLKDVQIKWPNDIVLNTKKIGGILTEMVVDKDGSNNVIVGVGINLNSTDICDELKDIATSYYIQTGEISSKTHILADICQEFENCYERFEKDGFKPFKEEYSKCCVTLNKKVVIKGIDNVFEGTAVEITDAGELVVDDGNITKTVASGEVSVRGLFGYI